MAETKKTKTTKKAAAPQVRRGRKSKLTPEKIELAVKLREMGFSLKDIAKSLKIDESRLYYKGTEWLELKNELNAIRAAQDIERNGKVENSLYKRATGQKVKTVREVLARDGSIVKLTEVKEIPGDVKAQEIYLTNRDPQRWKAAPEETTAGGKVDNQIKIIFEE